MLNKDVVIKDDQCEYIPNITCIKIPRKLKKQMKKERSWHNPVITFSGEATEYNINLSYRAMWLGL